MDEIYKVVLICFFDWICVVGMVELVGFDLVILEVCKVMIEMVVCDLFLYGGDFVKG